MAAVRTSGSPATRVERGRRTPVARPTKAHWLIDILCYSLPIVGLIAVIAARFMYAAQYFP
ncbi:MAG: hypothetical protein JO273_11630 [Methylobacteriaceae bacterium]|nr:hypothetical protein [Methylobacteriaceae bacterium]